MSDEQIVHVVGVVLFLREDALEHHARGRVLVGEVAHQLAVVLARDALRDEVLLDHVDELLGAAVFGCGARVKPDGIQVGDAAELVDPVGDLLQVLALVVRVLLELRLNALAVDADGRDGVHGVAQDADHLGRERRLQEVDRLLHLAFVVIGHRAALDVLLGAAAKLCDIGNERLGNGWHAVLPTASASFESTGGSERAQAAEPQNRIGEMITTGELKGIKAFERLDEGALALAASRSGDVRLAPGEWLLQEGDTPRFYGVVTGRLEISKRVAGARSVLRTFQTGDTFGEVPLLLGSAAIASVQAIEPSRLAVLDTTEFWRLMHTQEPFAAAVSGDMAARLKTLWSAGMGAPQARCTIVGDPNSPDCHRLRDFLTRLHVPFDWQERAGPQCNVTFADRRELISPGQRELAEALDLRTKPREHCYDVAIVGAGPAGLAAAVYGASEGLRTILLEREAPGGQAGMSSRIENYLGFPNGISGEELADRAFRQVNRFGADVVVTREALRIEGDPYHRRIVLDGDEIVHCRSVVLATGVSYRYLTAAGCDDFLNRGIYYGAAEAEAARVRGRHVHLLGGGNSAGQAAMFFSNYADRVTIVIRASDLSTSMSRYLIDELATRPSVDVIANVEIAAVEGNAEIETLVLRDVRDASVRREPTGALFVFIGADARTEWLAGFVATDERGYVLTGARSNAAGDGWPLEREPFLLETNQPGIFAVGDVRKDSVKRVASGVGEGATSIAMVHQILAEMTALSLQE